jgi:hypothetical protein
MLSIYCPSVKKNKSTYKLKPLFPTEIPPYKTYPKLFELVGFKSKVNALGNLAVPGKKGGWVSEPDRFST